MLVQQEDVYLNFVNSIKADVTKQIYEYNLRLFMEFCNVDKFEGVIGQQDKIIPYLMSLRERKLSYNSISTRLNAIYHFYDMNSPLLADPIQSDIFKGKPFYCWDTSYLEKRDCCFNHMIGLPKKDGITKPLFPYEKDVYDAWENNQHLWIKKATGLGISEFFLRLMLWLCLRNDDYQGCQMCIVTGPNIDLAKKLIKRMKDLIIDYPGFKFDTITDYVLEINHCWIQAYPSHNLGSFRSLDKAKFIFVDEGDFFPVGQLEEIRHVSERYIAKSNPWIVMVSTPNNPGGLFEQIENEIECLYHRMFLDYKVGLSLIYSLQDIENTKQSPSFEREYNLKYLGRVGNVFSPSQIQNCIDLGIEYSIDKIPVSLYTLKSVGIDPGFSSSGTGIVVLEHIKPELKEDKIRVIESHLIEKGDPNAIVKLCWDVWRRNNYMNTYFFIDGSNRAMVNLLKIRWDESLNWESKSTFGPTTRIRPVNFSTEHRNMLSNLHAIISKQYLAIEKKYDKLLTSLRTAYAEELNLKKEQTSYSDLLDALRLSLKGYCLE